MTSYKSDKNDDYCLVELPESEWPHIDKWFGSNVSLTSLVFTVLSKLQKINQNGPRKSLRLGIASIDSMVNGVAPGEVLYVGNEMEKCNAAFGLNIVRNLAIDRDKKVLVFNSGRGEYAFARGLISLCANINEDKLRRGDVLYDYELRRVEEVAEKILHSNVSIVSTPNICVESICDEVMKIKEADRPDVILIDNLRFLTSRKNCKNRQQEYRIVARKIWKLAKDTHIPVVLTGPLSKRRKKMTDYWPTACDMPADDMLDSFDKIVMVHKSRESYSPTLLNVTVVKNPEGSYGYRELEYESEHNEFIEILAQNKRGNNNE